MKIKYPSSCYDSLRGYKMQDPGDEQIILETSRPDYYCGGCLVAMIKIGENKFQCPNCKTTIGEI